MSTLLEPAAVGLAIRPFMPDDFPALASLHNAIWPDNLESEEDIRRWDQHRDPKCLQQRWIAERDGAAVGVGRYFQMEWMYHPRKFGCDVSVLPEHQRQGIGGALYDHVMAELDVHEPLAVRAWTREDYQPSVRFLTNRGFEEEERAFESRLDVTAFDPAPFDGAEERVLAQGFTIHTFGELALDRDDERLHRFYEVEGEMDEGIPAPEPLTRPSFEQWRHWIIDTPNRIDDAYFIALDGDEFVGASSLWRNPADQDLHTGFTGVRPAWRRRGIALALKLRAVNYARSHGVAVIRTDNSSLNRPMLSINEALGFQKLPAWVGFKKVLRAE